MGSTIQITTRWEKNTFVFLSIDKRVRFLFYLLFSNFDSSEHCWYAYPVMKSSKKQRQCTLDIVTNSYSKRKRMSDVVEEKNIYIYIYNGKERKRTNKKESMLWACCTTGLLPDWQRGKNENARVIVLLHSICALVCVECYVEKKRRRKREGNRRRPCQRSETAISVD